MDADVRRVMYDQPLLSQEKFQGRLSSTYHCTFCQASLSLHPLLFPYFCWWPVAILGWQAQVAASNSSQRQASPLPLLLLVAVCHPKMASPGCC